MLLYGIGCQAMYNSLENSIPSLFVRSVARFYEYLGVTGRLAARRAVIFLSLYLVGAALG